MEHEYKPQNYCAGNCIPGSLMFFHLIFWRQKAIPIMTRMRTKMNATDSADTMMIMSPVQWRNKITNDDGKGTTNFVVTAL